MPQSSKAPPDPYTGPTNSEIMQAEVVRIKKLLGLDVNRLAIGSDIEGIITGGLFGTVDYTVTGVNMISVVNVSTGIMSSQTNAPTAPTQVLGLNVTTGANNNTLNLTWTTNGSPGVTYYNIYRSLASGGEVLVDTSDINSYSDDNLLSGTTYFYKVAAVNDYGMVGTLSAEDSATTTGSPPPPTPMLELHYDSSFVDTSSNGYTPIGFDTNGFVTPGKFGSAAWKCNYPILGNPDFMYWTNTLNLQLDTSFGFSISVWVFPQDLSLISGSLRRCITEKRDDSNNQWTLQVDAAGLVQFHVKKAGVEYKRQISGLTTGSWQHIVATFNGVTNTVAVYRNAVAGVASVAASQWEVSAVNFWLGAQSASIGQTYSEGYFDELRYYKSVVLTPTQVTNLMNTNAP